MVQTMNYLSSRDRHITSDRPGDWIGARGGQSTYSRRDRDSSRSPQRRVQAYGGFSTENNNRPGLEQRGYSCTALRSTSPLRPVSPVRYGRAAAAMTPAASHLSSSNHNHKENATTSTPTSPIRATSPTRFRKNPPPNTTTTATTTTSTTTTSTTTTSPQRAYSPTRYSRSTNTTTVTTSPQRATSPSRISRHRTSRPEPVTPQASPSKAAISSNSSSHRSVSPSVAERQARIMKQFSSKSLSMEATTTSNNHKSFQPRPTYQYASKYSCSSNSNNSATKQPTDEQVKDDATEDETSMGSSSCSYQQLNDEGKETMVKQVAEVPPQPTYSAQKTTRQVVESPSRRAALEVFRNAEQTRMQRQQQQPSSSETTSSLRNVSLDLTRSRTPKESKRPEKPPCQYDMAKAWTSNKTTSNRSSKSKYTGETESVSSSGSSNNSSKASSQARQPKVQSEEDHDYCAEPLSPVTLRYPSTKTRYVPPSMEQRRREHSKLLERAQSMSLLCDPTRVETPNNHHISQTEREDDDEEILIKQVSARDLITQWVAEEEKDDAYKRLERAKRSISRRRAEQSIDFFSEQKRRDRAYQWYIRLGTPTRADMKKLLQDRRIDDTEPGDVDLLPWHAGNFVVNVSTMIKYQQKGPQYCHI